MINSGHCKTAFNGVGGTRDTAEGVGLVIQLVCSMGDEFKGGSLLEMDGEGVLKDVPW